MKAGDIISGYRITSEPTNDGGGKCVWAFAEKNGREYFIKRFLDPKRPKPGSTATTVSKSLRLQSCEEFEQRHKMIMNRLSYDTVGGGNLILALDFFHDGTTYYKVTERIDTENLHRPQSLTPGQKAVLLRTLGLSVGLLHGIDVVHGDLKPANVLVQNKGGGAFYTAKLIDFDDAYVSRQPPEREDIAGDSLYGAPEWRRYMQSDSDVLAGYLTTKVDIFALGLLAHHYLTGAVPRYDERFGSPADAVNAGTTLHLDHRLSDPMRELVGAMTSRAPDARPQIATFMETLKEPNVCELHRRESTKSKPVTPKVSRVRINIDKKENHR
ncbi:protein kinase domain-containing protein [Streptosporangium soli]|nr:serine/threonine protein kinase [Streptosporangium sp. KLBMP 9127]